MKKADENGVCPQFPIAGQSTKLDKTARTRQTEGVMMRPGILISLMLAPAAIVHAQDDGDIYQGSLESRVEALSSIQPGLGVVMHEYGYRFTDMYRAVNGGNWELAQYELKELREAQKVAEITRPARAGALKAFEKQQLVPLGEAISSQDITRFNARFTAAVKACNACHTATGHDFIQYQLPDKSGQGFLDYAVKSAPEYREEKEK